MSLFLIKCSINDGKLINKISGRPNVYLLQCITFCRDKEISTVVMVACFVCQPVADIAVVDPGFLRGRGGNSQIGCAYLALLPKIT